MSPTPTAPRRRRRRTIGAGIAALVAGFGFGGLAAEGTDPSSDAAQQASTSAPTSSSWSFGSSDPPQRTSQPAAVVSGAS